MNEAITVSVDEIRAIAPEVFRRVWRTTLELPGHPLGVLHKAVIPSPDPAGQRVINSIWHALASDRGSVLEPSRVEHFLTREDLD